MRTIVTCVLLSVLCPVTVLAQSLEGVWTVDEVVIGGGEDEGRHTADVQPGRYFFVGSNYSVMFVRGWEPRTLLSEDRTDEERLAAWSLFTANAGRFEVQGSTVTFTPSVAKNPNSMTDNSYEGELEWDGDTFWLTFDSNNGDWKNRVHYVRVED